MVYVPTDHSIKSTLLAVRGQVLFELEHKVHGFFHTIFEIFAQAPVSKSQPMADPVESAVEVQHKIIQSITQEAEPRCDPCDAIKQVSVCDQVMTSVQAYVFGLIDHFYHAKSYAVGYEWSEKLVMIASHIDHTGATLGMTQHSTYHIGMALFPTPLVLCHFPSIDDVTHKIECFAGVVFEKVVELLSLAVLGTKVHI